MDKLNFTKRELDALGLPQAGKRDFYRDEKERGLTLVVHPSGSKIFLLYKKINGRPEKIRIGPYPDISIEQARGKASELRGVIAKGENPAEFRRKLRAESTIKQVFELYKQNFRDKRKQSTWDEYEDTLRRYLKWDEPASRWCTSRLSQIRRHNVEELHANVGEENGPYAANRLLAVMRRLFNLCHGARLGWP